MANSIYVADYFFLTFLTLVIEQDAKRILGLNIEQNGSYVSVAANVPESCASFSSTSGI